MIDKLNALVPNLNDKDTSQQPRACGRCQFRDVMQQPPPSIEKMKVCRLHPRQLTQLPSQGGVMQLQGFPVVTDEDWCYQFVERDSGV